MIPERKKKGKRIEGVDESENERTEKKLKRPCEQWKKKKENRRVWRDRKNHKKRNPLHAKTFFKTKRGWKKTIETYKGKESTDQPHSISAFTYKKKIFFWFVKNFKM